MATTTSAPRTGARVRVQQFGTFLSNMVLPNIAAFIAWGFITALFIEVGWITLIGDKVFDLNGGMETLEQTDGALGAAYTFRDVPAPLADIAFVYVAPTLIVEVPVDLEFKGVRISEREK